MTIRENDKLIKQNFIRDGYVVIRGFLSLTETQSVSDRVSHFIRETLPRLDPAEVMYEDKKNPKSMKQIPHLDAHVPFFGEMLRSDPFVHLSELLLEDQVSPVGMQWFDKPPGISKPTPAHQDGFFFMLEPNEAVTMWLALDDVDDANGCIRYVPGSHKAGMRSHGKTEVVGFSQAITDFGEKDRQQEVAIHAQPGDLLVHHSMTIHSAGGNTTSNRHRRALQLVYYAQRAKQDKDRWQAYEASLKSELINEGKL